MIPCRYCGKEIAKGTESFNRLKKKLKSFDMYWFCNNEICLKEYLKLDFGKVDCMDDEELHKWLKKQGIKLAGEKLTK